jgi:NAD(P)-dependent dehydrogenase (short-subunit alcohol dehydrogenase family)
LVTNDDEGTMMGRACEGKVALIAGASQGGTGTGSAVRLAAEGAKVAICARSAAKLEETLGRIEVVGGTGVMFECDLADPHGGRDTLVARTEAALGPIDYLVYVAARTAFARFDTVLLDRLQSVLEVNLKAAWLLNQHAVTSMRARGSGGSVVNIGTMAARPLSGPPYGDGPSVRAGTAYGASKAALHRMSQGIAAETHGERISVNVVSPLAAIATPTVIAGGMIPQEVCEPVETMVEAVLALLTGDPDTLTGLDTTSIELLRELRRPVHDLAGAELVPGWQPDDLVGFMEAVGGRRR